MKLGYRLHNTCISHPKKKKIRKTKNNGEHRKRDNINN